MATFAWILSALGTFWMVSSTVPPLIIDTESWNFGATDASFFPRKGEDWNHGVYCIMFDSMFNIVSIRRNFRIIIRSDWLHGWVDSRIKNQWWTKRAGHGNMFRSLRPIHRNFWSRIPKRHDGKIWFFPWYIRGLWFLGELNDTQNPNPLRICRLVNHYILKLGTWWAFFLFGNLGIPKTLFWKWWVIWLRWLCVYFVT